MTERMPNTPTHAEVYELTECPRVPRLVGSLWGREVSHVEPDWGCAAIAHYTYHAFEPRDDREARAFKVSCMDWEEGNAWLPDHMGTWVVVEGVA